MSAMDTVNVMAERAQNAYAQMRLATTAAKNDALRQTASIIDKRRAHIVGANKSDVESALRNNRPDAFIDRMSLTNERLDAIIVALDDIADLDDPVGTVIKSWTRPNGLEITRVRTPIGVIAVIYESRPNVTVDAAAIALKAGNAVILRGGSECLASNRALFECIQSGCEVAGLPADGVQFVDSADRDIVGGLLSGVDGRIDLVIPRGGKSLVARVRSDARAPVLSHLDGVCHVYIDRSANQAMALEIAVNSKMRRTGVCGAAETLLVDRGIAEDILPTLERMFTEQRCEIRADAQAGKFLPSARAATDEDYYTEYLAPVISLALVDGVDGAVAHIAKYGSGHTDAIVADDKNAVATFTARVDSAIVLHNASTQFADGGEFGLGGEIGIATGRLHARGPVGVEELTTYKNLVRGSGQIRP